MCIGMIPLFILVYCMRIRTMSPLVAMALLTILSVCMDALDHSAVQPTVRPTRFKSRADSQTDREEAITLQQLFVKANAYSRYKADAKTTTTQKSQTTDETQTWGGPYKCIEPEVQTQRLVRRTLNFCLPLVMGQSASKRWTTATQANPRDH